MGRLIDTAISEGIRKEGAAYPTFHPNARETRIDVTDPVYGKGIGQVCLRPVNLERLESIVADTTANGRRQREDYASLLAFGKGYAHRRKAL